MKLLATLGLLFLFSSFHLAVSNLLGTEESEIVESGVKHGYESENQETDTAEQTAEVTASDSVSQESIDETSKAATKAMNYASQRFSEVMRQALLQNVEGDDYQENDGLGSLVNGALSAHNKVDTTVLKAASVVVGGPLYGLATLAIEISKIVEEFKCGKDFSGYDITSLRDDPSTRNNPFARAVIDVARGIVDVGRRINEVFGSPLDPYESDDSLARNQRAITAFFELAREINDGADELKAFLDENTGAYAVTTAGRVAIAVSLEFTKACFIGLVTVFGPAAAVFENAATVGVATLGVGV